MSKVFDCDSCHGVCCVNPPQITDSEDYNLAKRHGVRLLATDMGEGVFYLTVAKGQNKTCPFLQEGECSIYQDNFKVCDHFVCKSKDKDIKRFTEELLLTTTKGLQSVGNLFQAEVVETLLPKAFTRGFCERNGIEILTMEESIYAISATDQVTFINLIDKTYKKL